MNLRKHYIHSATKNAAIALNMAQQVSNKEGIPHSDAVQELVYLINSAALALQRVCTSMEYTYNDKRGLNQLHKGKLK